jgi:xylitol oxidase
VIPTNWAGNIAYRARQFHRPSSIVELQSLVQRSDRVRALGTGHSFNEIADTTGELVSVASLPPVVEIDPTAGQVSVSAGTRYGELTAQLQAAGWALPNLGSLPHISIAGACSTGTHGSGDRNPILAAAVTAIELVTADGDLLTIDDQAADFRGAVVALGSLGIVTRLTLKLVPTFDLRQYVVRDLPFDEFTEHADEIFASGYSVSAFTDWQSAAIDQVWLKRLAAEAPPPQQWFGATLTRGGHSPLPGMSAENCTDQTGAAGPWNERLPHFRLEFTPSSGEELQSEYFVPREHAIATAHELRALSDQLAPVLQIGEIRTMAGDDLWLSPAHGRDSVAFHFTWVQDADAVRPVLTLIEDRLAPFAARPHWGKLFNTTPDALARLYPHLDDFMRLRQRLDPADKFGNSWLTETLPTI